MNHDLTTSPTSHTEVKKLPDRGERSSPALFAERGSVVRPPATAEVAVDNSEHSGRDRNRDQDEDHEADRNAKLIGGTAPPSHDQNRRRHGEESEDQGEVPRQVQPEALLTSLHPLESTPAPHVQTREQRPEPATSRGSSRRRELVRDCDWLIDSSRRSVLRVPFGDVECTKSGAYGSAPFAD